MIANDERTPAGWLSEVTLKGSESPVRVLFVRRQGSQVLIRQVDPCDQEPDRIPLYEDDQIVLAEAISHISINTTDKVGDVTGFLFGVRVVEVRRETGRVFARTLRNNEYDTGARVHMFPGESLTFGEGSVVAELDYIDKIQDATESGYVPLAPVLSTWFSVGSHDETEVRYLMAAARRLDEANFRLIDIENCRSLIAVEGTPGPELRRNGLRLLGAIESAIIALGRVVDMAIRADKLIGSSIPVPTSIATHQSAIRGIRNAYEHIEDRALGHVHNLPHPHALSIFDYRRLIAEDVIVYGSQTISLKTDMPTVIEDARQFLKDVAGGPRDGGAA